MFLEVFNDRVKDATTMNQLMLDPSDPEMAEAVADCKVGDRKSFRVEGVVSAMGDEFVLDVDKVEYAEGYGEEKPKEKMPVKKRGGNPALVVLVGKGERNG